MVKQSQKSWQPDLLLTVFVLHIWVCCTFFYINLLCRKWLKSYKNHICFSWRKHHQCSSFVPLLLSISKSRTTLTTFIQVLGVPTCSTSNPQHRQIYICWISQAHYYVGYCLSLVLQCSGHLSQTHPKRGTLFLFFLQFLLHNTWNRRIFLFFTPSPRLDQMLYFSDVHLFSPCGLTGTIQFSAELQRRANCWYS